MLGLSPVTVDVLVLVTDQISRVDRHLKVERSGFRSCHERPYVYVSCDGYVCVSCDGYVCVPCDGYVCVSYDGYVYVSCDGYVCVSCDGYVCQL